MKNSEYLNIYPVWLYQYSCNVPTHSKMDSIEFVSKDTLICAVKTIPKNMLDFCH